MKAGVKPVLSSTWWKANKGATVSGPALETALKKYETLKGAFENAIETPSADGYAAFQAAREALGIDVVKAVEKEIASCNKVVHKDTIAGLTRYKTEVIPAEKTLLDNSFKQYKARHEGEFNSMVSAANTYIKALEELAHLAARTMLECEAAAPEADKALAEAASARGDKAANAAMNKAMAVGAQIAARHKALVEAVKNAPKEVAIDKTKGAPSDRPALLKLIDVKSRHQAQLENNLAKVGEINKTVQGIMSAVRQAATGAASAENALEGAFQRMVNRAFALAQTNDVPARELTSALGNLRMDIESYGETEDAVGKAAHKKQAMEDLRLSKLHANNLRIELDRSKAEIGGLLKSMPAGVVNRQSPVFGPLFVQLDKATKAFDDDTATLLKKSEDIQKMEATVGNLA